MLLLVYEYCIKEKCVFPARCSPEDVDSERLWSLILLWRIMFFVASPLNIASVVSKWQKVVWTSDEWKRYKALSFSLYFSHPFSLPHSLSLSLPLSLSLSLSLPPSLSLSFLSYLLAFKCSLSLGHWWFSDCFGQGCQHPLCQWDHRWPCGTHTGQLLTRHIIKPDQGLIDPIS